MGELEKDIGELKGLFQPLSRTVEKISERVDENRDKITEVSTEVSNHKKEVWHTVRKLENSEAERMKADQATHDRIISLEMAEKRAKGAGKFAMRILEMAIAALIGATSAWLLGG